MAKNTKNKPVSGSGRQPADEHVYDVPSVYAYSVRGEMPKLRTYRVKRGRVKATVVDTSSRFQRRKVYPLDSLPLFFSRTPAEAWRKFVKESAGRLRDWERDVKRMRGIITHGERQLRRAELGRA